MSEEPSIQSAPEPTTKKTNVGLIIGIVVVVLLCCCCLTLVGGFALLRPMVSETFQSIQEDFLDDPYDLPTVPEVPDIFATPNPSTDDFETPDFESPDFDFEFQALDDYVPQGGLGDLTLRADTWLQVMMASVWSNCDVNDATQTVIEVLQRPDADGMWQEQWTVTCDDGSTKSYDITFIPDAQGGTNISVTESH